MILFNASDTDVNLEGWEVRDSRDRSDRFDNFWLSSGGALRLTLSSVRLLNTGESIALYNRSGQQVHQVEYSAEEASREGWWIKF